MRIHVTKSEAPIQSLNTLVLLLAKFHQVSGPLVVVVDVQYM